MTMPSIEGYLSVDELKEESRDFALYGLTAILANIPIVASFVSNTFHVNAGVATAGLVFIAFIYKRWKSGIPINIALEEGLVTVGDIALKTPKDEIVNEITTQLTPSQE